jgi:hypothetical protein
MRQSAEPKRMLFCGDLSIAGLRFRLGADLYFALK